jgi:hypothetical protein
MTTAFILEGVKPGSGLWFWDCPVCPCAFGPLVLTRTEAKRQGREHDAECHPEPAPGED